MLPRGLTARSIAALASNPGCRRRALLDAAAVRKDEVAAWAGFPAPFGISPFARAREQAFRRQLEDDPGGLFLQLLRQALNLDITEVGYLDLGQDDDPTHGPRDYSQRYRQSREALKGAPLRRGTLYYRPLLRFRVGGRYAYLEPELVAFRHDDTYHVVEIKSFPVIDGQADAASLSAAALQSAVYVLALRDLLGRGKGAAKVHHETVLITPRDFSNRPVAATVDVRKQLGTVRRQLARLDRIPDLLALLPEDLTFDLQRDERKVAHRDPADLGAALRQVQHSYAPQCLATCELCYFCRDEAAGQTGVLGREVRDELGGLEDIGSVLRLARNDDGLPVGEDRAEAAGLLRRAHALRAEALR